MGMRRRKICSLPATRNDGKSQGKKNDRAVRWHSEFSQPMCVVVSHPISASGTNGPFALSPAFQQRHLRRQWIRVIPRSPPLKPYARLHARINEVRKVTALMAASPKFWPKCLPRVARGSCPSSIMSPLVNGLINCDSVMETDCCPSANQRIPRPVQRIPPWWLSVRMASLEVPKTANELPSFTWLQFVAPRCAEKGCMFKVQINLFTLLDWWRSV